MVHFIKHNYKGDFYYFLWDIESGSLHNVDYVAFLCAKKRYNKEFSQSESQDFNNIPVDEVNEINSCLKQLEDEGALKSKPVVTNFKKNSMIVKALCLNICHDCNMRCGYCFASGGSYNTPRNYMTVEVAKKAVDFLIENSGSRKNLEIDFFGGEPLLNLQVIKDTVEYAKQKANEKGKVFHFTTTTNCVLLDDETIEYLNKEMSNVVLSIDGKEKTHDDMRHSLIKDKGYKEILSAAKKMKEARGDKSYYVRGTFTARNLDFAADIFALNDEGFDQISIEPVVLDDSSPLAIKEEHIESVKKEYQKFANEYLNRRQTNKWFNFFHFMNDLETGPCVNKRMTGCGAGTEYLSISPIGGIYPCHQFVGIEEFLLGNVFEGISRQDIRERFADISILTKPECAECFAKYNCGGGCIANAYKYAKGIECIYDKGCEMTRERFYLSLAVAGIEKLINDAKNYN